MFKPSYDRLLVEPCSELEERTISGIILPGGGKLTLMRGKILKTGKGHLMPDYKFRECEHKEGNTIVYYRHDASPVYIEGKEYHILKDNQPFGIIEEKKDLPLSA